MLSWNMFGSFSRCTVFMMLVEKESELFAFWLKDYEERFSLCKESKCNQISFFVLFDIIAIYWANIGDPLRCVLSSKAISEESSGNTGHVWQLEQMEMIYRAPNHIFKLKSQLLKCFGLLRKTTTDRSQCCVNVYVLKSQFHYVRWKFWDVLLMSKHPIGSLGTDGSLSLLRL